MTASGAVCGGRRRRWPVVLAAALVVPAVLAGCSDPEGTGSGDAQRNAPLGIDGTWDLVHADEFDGASLDEEVWQANRYGRDGRDAPFNPGSEDASFDSGNVSVADGALRIRIQDDTHDVDGREYRFTSGVVETAPQHLLQPGYYVEARIDVPECDRCWPAFWAVPPDSWPPEIDIMEYFDTGQDTRPSFNYISAADTRTGPDVYGDADVDHRDGYHVYGLLWDGSTATPVLDGVPYPAVTATDVTDLPLTLILNLSVGSGGTPTAGDQMSVDWVRIWSPVREETSSP